MAQNIDIDFLRRLSEDTRSVYWALARARILAAETEGIGAMADDLLQRAGLLFLAEGQVGASSALDTSSAPTVGMAASFAQVQKAFVALHEALYRLAENAVARGLWAEAQPMLKMLAELDATDTQIKQLYERSLPLGSAQRALEAGQWDAARQYIEPWLKQHKEDKEAFDLFCESYYRSGMQALEAGKPEAALLLFLTLMELEQGFRDAPELLKQAYQGLPKQMHPKIPGLEFVKIPAGEFRYGEGKQKVHLDEFWIARTPVTNAQYQVFVKATDYQAPSHWSNSQPPRGKEQHPVVNVSWDDAQKFCGWAGLSLPSERQWEKAARGSDGRTYPWGEAAPDSRRCNFNNQVSDTTLVGSYPEGASPYGLLNMAGNVWEWCEDPYDAGFRHRVLRGGAFDSAEGYVRCALRLRYWSGGQVHSFGFRVVVTSF